MVYKQMVEGNNRELQAGRGLQEVMSIPVPQKLYRGGDTRRDQFRWWVLWV